MPAHLTRILPTPQNIHVLFNPTTLPYPVPADEGGYHYVEMPAWECKGCGWKSLYGVKNLAFPHECPSPPGAWSGVVEPTAKFAG